MAEYDLYKVEVRNDNVSGIDGGGKERVRGQPCGKRRNNVPKYCDSGHTARARDLLQREREREREEMEQE